MTSLKSLALASPADLVARGLSTDYDNYEANNQVPGEYVAVIAPGGSHGFGRSGGVRAGAPRRGNHRARQEDPAVGSIIRSKEAACDITRVS